MTRPFLRSGLFGVFAVSAFAPHLAPAADVAPASADEAAQPAAVRFVEGDSSARLETAITRMRSESGDTIDLIGAVHIADADYYESLNDRFKNYDALLFELVGGDGNVGEKVASPPSDPANPIRFFQVLLRNQLGLVLQLDAIDYTAPNFVHADMTADEFTDEQEARGESFITLMQRALRIQIDKAAENAHDADGDSSSGAEDAQPSLDIGAFMNLFSSDADASELKLAMGRHLADVESIVEGMEGEDGSVILSGRNAKAVEKIKEILTPAEDRIGVFYGAAHLPGLTDLLEPLGFSTDETEWLTAWEIPVKSTVDSPEESPASAP